MPKTLHCEEEVLQLIRTRNRAGAEALYDQYTAVLRLAIFRITKDKDLTDILFEKALCKIWDTFDLYDEQKQALLTWMLSVTKNLANQYTATAQPA